MIWGCHFLRILGSTWVRYPSPGTLRTRRWSREAPDRKNIRFVTHLCTIMGSSQVLVELFFGCSWYISDVIVKVVFETPSAEAPRPAWERKLTKRQVLGRAWMLLKPTKFRTDLILVCFYRAPFQERLRTSISEVWDGLGISYHADGL